MNRGSEIQQRLQATFYALPKVLPRILVRQVLSRVCGGVHNNVEPLTCKEGIGFTGDGCNRKSRRLTLAHKRGTDEAVRANYREGLHSDVASRASERCVWNQA